MFELTLNTVGFTIVVILIFATFLFFIIQKIRYSFRSRNVIGLDKNKIKKQWQDIESLLNRKSEVSYKLAIVEADKLFDHVLKHMFFAGSTMGERLKVASFKYVELRKVWWAHSIRNKLVHEAGYRLNYRTAKKAISTFEHGLKHLGIL